MMTGPPGAPSTQEGLVVLENDGGSHGRKRRLPGAMDFARLARVRTRCWVCGLGGEVIHFRCSAEIRRRQSDAAAVSAIQGVSDGNCVALLVYDAVVRVLVPSPVEGRPGLIWSLGVAAS